MTFHSRRVSPTRPSAANQQLLIAYRAQLSSLIQMERVLVDAGMLAPEERRVLSREERRSKGVGDD